MSGDLTIRIATEADFGTLRALMTLSIDYGQAAMLTSALLVPAATVYMAGHMKLGRAVTAPR